MKEFFKKLARWIFSDYSIYHVYSQSADKHQVFKSKSKGLDFAVVTKAQVAASGDKLIRDQVQYHGPDAHVYACLKDSRILGLCYFWHGANYEFRQFWPLKDGEAKLVQIVTIPEMRDLGIAGDLITNASSEMFRIGFQCLYARIWHSHTASIRAFRRAGWNRVATVVEVNPLRRKIPLRITFGKSLRLCPV